MPESRTTCQPCTLVDTHTHLQFPQFDTDRDAVIARAVAAGVTRLIAVGCDLADSRAALELAERHPEVVWATVGLHPNAAADWNEQLAAELAELARHPRCVAIGETGLDFFRDRCPRDRQQAAFAFQQALAVERGLPLVVHARDSHDAVIAALHAAGGWATRVVLHCSTSRPDAARAVVTAGGWLGMDGPVTYPKAADAHQIAAETPLDRLLLETDTPYLAPQQHRGRRCEPAYLVDVAAEIARLRGLPTAAVASATTAAAAAFFGWAGS